MKHTAAVLSVLVLAGCGGAPAAPFAAPPPPPATTTMPAGPGAFLSFAHSAEYGTKDFTNAPDEALLGVGNSVCTGMDSLTFGQVVQGLVGANGAPSPAEAEAFARSAVTNLCPQHAGKLP